jgi:hypothetical protein
VKFLSCSQLVILSLVADPDPTYHLADKLAYEVDVVGIGTDVDRPASTLAVVYSGVTCTTPCPNSKPSVSLVNEAPENTGTANRDESEHTPGESAGAALRLYRHEASAGSQQLPPESPPHMP